MHGGSTSCRRSTMSYIDKAIAEFRDIDPDYIMVGHRTGDHFYGLARAELGDKVIPSAVGTRFVFNAA